VNVHGHVTIDREYSFTQFKLKQNTHKYKTTLFKYTCLNLALCITLLLNLKMSPFYFGRFLQNILGVFKWKSFTIGSRPTLLQCGNKGAIHYVLRYRDVKS